MEQPTSGTVIELHYTLSCDDIVAFNLHHISTSKTAQRTRRQVLLSIPLMILVIMAITLHDDLARGRGIARSLLVIIPLTLFILFFGFGYPKYYRWNIQ